MIVYKGRDFSVEVLQVTLPNEREVTVEVTSVLQSPSGKMIFTKLPPAAGLDD